MIQFIQRGVSCFRIKLNFLILAHLLSLNFSIAVISLIRFECNLVTIFLAFIGSKSLQRREYAGRKSLPLYTSHD